MQEMINQLVEKERKREITDAIEAQLDFQTQAFDRTATYNNVVVTLGYAGFLAFWIYLQDKLDVRIVLASGLLLGFSLLLFISFNVWQTFYLSSHRVTLVKALADEDLSPDERWNKFQTCEKKQRQKGLVLVANWYWVFLLSATSGFLAGMLMVIAMGAKLLQQGNVQ